jgi:predicted DNA-binding transcriptional regulator AlpA
LKRASAQPQVEPLAPFYRQRELLQLLGISRVTLWTWRRNPKMRFPAGVQLGPNTVAWRRSDIEAWLSTRPAA